MLFVKQVGSGWDMCAAVSPEVEVLLVLKTSIVWLIGAVHLKMVKELLQNAEHGCRPAKSRNDENVTRFCTFISDWRVVNEQTLNENGISIWIGPKDCMHAKFVPHILLRDQMETRTVTAGKLFEQSVHADFLLNY